MPKTQHNVVKRDEKQIENSQGEFITAAESFPFLMPSKQTNCRLAFLRLYDVTVTIPTQGA